MRKSILLLEIQKYYLKDPLPCPYEITGRSPSRISFNKDIFENANKFITTKLAQSKSINTLEE